MIRGASWNKTWFGVKRFDFFRDKVCVTRLQWKARTRHVLLAARELRVAMSRLSYNFSV